MDLKEIVCDGAGWIQLAEDRIHWHVLVSMEMSLWVPLKMRIILAI
jgi:hypothetical protein